MSARQVFARTVRHPGPPHPIRIASLEGRGLHHQFTLAAGRSLRDAISLALTEAGLDGGTVRFENLHVAPLHFLMPALAVDDQHAAFYSAPHAIEEGVFIEYACATYGRKDGEPFVHCHAVWRGRDGERQGGHLIMDKTMIAASAPAHAWGLQGVSMVAQYDAETNFTLFHPARLEPAAATIAAVPTVSPSSGKRMVLARIRPDEDLCLAIEETCRLHGMHAAIVHGSVGSIIGAEFEDGRVVEDRATEILIRSGEVRSGAQGLQARLDIALVNPQGKVCEGVLARARNPVLICFELVLEEQ